MPGPVTSNQPWEPDDATWNAGVQNENPGLGVMLSDTVDQGPSAAVSRAAERGMSPDASYLDKTLNLFGQSMGQNPVDVKPVIEPAAEPMLEPSEVKRQFGLDTAVPMSASLAGTVAKQKADETRENEQLANFSNSHGILTNFAAGTVGFLMDPLNAAVSVLPVAGEGGIASRMAYGALSNVAAMAPQELAKLTLGREQQSDYGIADFLRNEFFNGAFGAALGGISGVVGKLIEGHGVPDVIKNATPDQNLNAMKGSVAEILRGEQATTGSYIFPEAGAQKSFADLVRDREYVNEEISAPGLDADDAADIAARVYGERGMEELNVATEGTATPEEVAKGKLAEANDQLAAFQQRGGELSPETADELATVKQKAADADEPVNDAAACIGAAMAGSAVE